MAKVPCGCSVEIMAPHHEAKIHFGPMRTRASSAFAGIGAVLVVVSVLSFVNHDSAQAWIALVAAVFFFLMARSVFVRYLTIDGNGITSIGYRRLLIPSSKLRAFSDIERIDVGVGQGPLLNRIVCPVIFMSAGDRRLFTSISRTAKPKPGNEDAIRFDTLISELRETVRRAHE
jgi:hypothetical protein